MTLREIDRATQGAPIYIKARAGQDANALLTDLLRGCGGVYDMEVYQIEIAPGGGLLCSVDLPAEIVRAIRKYNTDYYGGPKK